MKECFYIFLLLHCRARRRARCQLLNARHRAVRRIWANEHRNWRIREWSRCLFVDETRINLRHSDGRILVWREPNERFEEENMVAEEPFGGGGLTVFGGIMMNGKTDLFITNQTITAATYRDGCIIPIVIPFAQNFGNDFVLVDDNARPHRAGIVNEILNANGITRMIWPPKSPDCNPIEHVWSNLKLRLRQRADGFDNVQQLEQVIREEWERIPQLTINFLVQSMPNRCRDVIRCRGGPTKY